MVIYFYYVAIFADIMKHVQLSKWLTLQLCVSDIPMHLYIYIYNILHRIILGDIWMRNHSQSGMHIQELLGMFQYTSQMPNVAAIFTYITVRFLGHILGRSTKSDRQQHLWGSLMIR